MCVYGGHPGPLITGAVCQQLERLECILPGYINQCVITSKYRDRLAKKQDERHRHQVTKRLQTLSRYWRGTEGLKVGYWGTRRWKPVPEETVRGLRFAGKVVSLVQLPDGWLCACLCTRQREKQGVGGEKSPCLVGLAHFCLGCSDMWIGWYRPGLSTPWSEHPVGDISPGSLGHPDQAKAQGVNLLSVCAMLPVGQWCCFSLAFGKGKKCVCFFFL